MARTSVVGLPTLHARDVGKKKATWVGGFGVDPVLDELAQGLMYLKKHIQIQRCLYYFFIKYLYWSYGVALTLGLDLVTA